MSSFELNVAADISQVERYLTDVQKKVVPKAAARSINRAANKVQATARSMVSKKIGLAQKKFKKILKVTVKAKPSSLYASVKGTGKELNMIEFVAPSKQRVGAFKKKEGVTAKPYGKKKIYKGAFIGRGQNSGKLLVFKRQNKNRKSIKAMYGPSIPKTMIQKVIVQAMKIQAGKTWKKEFPRNMKFYLSKLK